MKFLVCMKQVVDASKTEVDLETGRLKRNNANSITNPVDLNALEAALSLRDQVGGTVEVMTMGPPQAEAVLLDALSRGADRGYLVTDRVFGGADTLATSYTLAETIKSIGIPNIIFCGVESIDSNTAQIGPEIAATLGMADVSAISDIRYDKSGILTVWRKSVDDVEVLELKLPAVVTVLDELNKPRYPSVKGILNKKAKEIHRITAADLDIDLNRVGFKGSPTQVKNVGPVAVFKKENLYIENQPMEDMVNVVYETLKKLSLV